MILNVDNNSDPLRQLFWRNWLTLTLICLVVSSIVGICSQSPVAGFLSYFLLSFIMTELVVYKLCRKMDQESENCSKNGM